MNVGNERQVDVTSAAIPRRRFMSLAALAGCALWLPSSAARAVAFLGLVEHRRVLWSMGGWNHLSVEAESVEMADTALGAMMRKIRQVDQEFSVFDTRSSLARLNSATENDIPIDNPGVLNAISSSLKWAQSMEGFFDPTVEPLMAQWGFRGEMSRLTHVSRTAIERTSSYLQIICDKHNARILRESALLEIDSGGWAKGLAAENAVKAAIRAGASSAQASCGGDIYRESTIGPAEWDCFIRHPLNGRMSVAYRVRQHYRTAATSANYESSRVEASGVHVGHLMNPRLGRPADTDLLSVTVFGDDGLAVDAVSSGLFVMGKQRAVRWLAAHPEFAAVLIDESWPVNPAGVTAVGKLELGSA